MKSQKTGQIQTLSFEKSLEKLEILVKKLESGELTLEESVKAFEEGVKLSHFYSQKLDEAEKKVEILLSKNGEDSEFKKQPFKV